MNIMCFFFKYCFICLLSSFPYTVLRKVLCYWSLLPLDFYTFITLYTLIKSIRYVGKTQNTIKCKGPIYVFLRYGKISKWPAWNFARKKHKNHAPKPSFLKEGKQISTKKFEHPDRAAIVGTERVERSINEWREQRQLIAFYFRSCARTSPLIGIRLSGLGFVTSRI